MPMKEKICKKVWTLIKENSILKGHLRN